MQRDLPSGGDRAAEENPELLAAVEDLAVSRGGQRPALTFQTPPRQSLNHIPALIIIQPVDAIKIGRAHV